jgi:hypothetical protein
MIERRELFDIFSTFHLLVILSIALSAMAMPPKGDAITGLALARHFDLDYPNIDCDIVPIPDKGGCLEPENCHKSGGLCFVPKKSQYRSRATRCRQGAVDPTNPLGYKIQKWTSLSTSVTIRTYCAGCQCVPKASPPRKRTRKANKMLLDKLRATRARQQHSPSTDRSSSSIDEERPLNRASPQEPQHLTEAEVLQTPQTPLRVPISSVDEEVPTTRYSAEPEDESQLLLQYPTYVHPYFDNSG